MRESGFQGLRLFWAAAFTVIFLALHSFRALALDAGEYLVTVTPSYTDPDSGKIEDPGNNAAIGQGMTERLCGSTGLLEVDRNGNMWLTVRYYLSQFVSNVSFEERSGGSYLSRSHAAMQTKAPVAGATDITEKYGFTDYRFPIASMDSVFRGKAYIEPMGRDVVYFLTVSSPVKGSGDFVVSAKAAEPETTAAPAETAAAQAGNSSQTGAAAQTSGAASQEAAQSAGTQTAGQNAAAANPTAGTQNTGSGNTAQAGNDPYAYYPEELEDEDWESGGTGNGVGTGTAAGADAGSGVTAGNGSGNADDPVTGIPQKPGSVGAGSAAGTTGATGAAGASGTGTGATVGAGTEQWSAATGETASAEARKYGESLLKDAVGITMTVGGAVALPTETEAPQKETNGYQNMMYILIGAAAALLICFAFSSLKKTGGRAESRGSRADEDADAPDEIERKQGGTR